MLTARLRQARAGVFDRYVSVSVFNIVGHQLVLFVANSRWGWSAANANVLAAVTMGLIGYVLNRNWVWRMTGEHSFRSQFLPFFELMVAGLVLSSAMSASAERIFGAGLAVNIASFLGYLIVWIAKFFVLNRVFVAADDT